MQMPNQINVNEAARSHFSDSNIQLFIKLMIWNANNDITLISIANEIFQLNHYGSYRPKIRLIAYIEFEIENKPFMNMMCRWLAIRFAWKTIWTTIFLLGIFGTAT